MTTRFQKTIGFPKPVKRVRIRPVSRKVGQAIKRTKRPRKVRKTPLSTLKNRADKLFSKIVRHPQVCTYHLDAERAEFVPHMKHNGVIQCAHLVTRGRHTVRWDEENAMPICSGAHVWFTHNPDAWDEYLGWKFGSEIVEALKARSRADWDMDIESVLVRLASRAVVLGIEPARGRGVGSDKSTEAI